MQYVTAVLLSYMSRGQFEHSQKTLKWFQIQLYIANYTSFNFIATVEGLHLP